MLTAVGLQRVPFKCNVSSDRSGASDASPRSSTDVSDSRLPIPWVIRLGAVGHLSRRKRLLYWSVHRTTVDDGGSPPPAACTTLSSRKAAFRVSNTQCDG